MPGTRPQWIVLTLDAYLQQFVTVRMGQSCDWLVFQLAGGPVLCLDLVAYLNRLHGDVAVAGMDWGSRGEAQGAGFAFELRRPVKLHRLRVIVFFLFHSVATEQIRQTLREGRTRHNRVAACLGRLHL